MVELPVHQVSLHQMNVLVAGDALVTQRSCLIRFLNQDVLEKRSFTVIWEQEMTRVKVIRRSPAWAFWAVSVKVAASRRWWRGKGWFLRQVWMREAPSTPRGGSFSLTAPLWGLQLDVSLPPYHQLQGTHRGRYGRRVGTAEGSGAVVLTRGASVEVVVILRDISQDAEAVRDLESHHVFCVQQGRNSQLLLRNRKGLEITKAQVRGAERIKGFYHINSDSLDPLKEPKLARI